MPPRRRSRASPPADEQKGIDAPPAAAGTLGEVSAQSVQTLLSRSNRRRAARGLRGATPAAAAEDLACGARAVAGHEEDGDGGQLAVETGAAERDAGRQLQAGAGEAPEAEEDTGWEWEGKEAAHEEHDWEEVEGGGSEEDEQQREEEEVIEISDASDGGVQDVSAERGAKQASAAERQLVRRARLLCLLARGRLLDAGADDPVLQASLLSLLPREVADAVDSRAGLSAEDLAPVVAWFRRTFQQVPLRSAEQLASEVAEEGDATKPGAEVHRALVAAAAARRGSAEELACVAVALLRGLGCVVRLVAVLEPSPRERSLRATGKMARVRRSGDAGQGGGRAVSSGPATSSSGPGSVPTGAEEGSPGNARPQRGRKRGATSGSVPATGRSTRGRGRGRGRERDRDSGRAAGARSEEGTAPDACGAAEPEGAAAKRRRGDLEMERELEMALAATAIAAGVAPAVDDSAPAAADPKTEEGKPGSGPSGGAAWSRRLPPHEVCTHWAEVFCGRGSTGRWVHVDGVMGYVAQELAVDLGGRFPGAYAVAFRGGGAKDVTAKYIEAVKVKDSKRVDADWWEETMRPLRHAEAVGAHPEAAAVPSARTATSAPATPRAALASAAELEDSQMAAKMKVLTEALPTTVDGFKSHPMYVLKRHIGKYQGLVPGTKAAGLHRGEPFYERAALSELHTAERWRREGRVVREGELASPFKVEKKRKVPPPRPEPSFMPRGRGRGGGWRRPPPAPSAGRGPALAAGEAGLEDGEEAGVNPREAMQLYGLWQTEELVLPVARDGKVPKNERLQVDCPPYAAALPGGTVHLPYKNISAACRKLGVDYAPAMVGFEIRAGRSVPKFAGVVVCEEFAEEVEAAYLDAEAQAKEREERKERDLCDRTWRGLLNAVWMRVKLAKRAEEDSAMQRQVVGGGPAGPAAPDTASAGTTRAITADSLEQPMYDALGDADYEEI